MPRPVADLPRRAVVAEWDVWASKHVPAGTVPTQSEAARFYTYLQRNRPALLESVHGISDDKWETVHKWLLRVYRVRD